MTDAVEQRRRYDFAGKLAGRAQAHLAGYYSGAQKAQHLLLLQAAVNGAVAALGEEEVKAILSNRSIKAFVDAENDHVKGVLQRIESPNIIPFPRETST